MRLEFRAVGVPQPQGSARAFMLEGFKRPIITSANPNLKQWRELVATSAGAALPAGWTVMKGPVVLSMVFYLPRPKSLPKRVTAHLKKPDLDKLIRGCKDAMTRVVWADDSQVVYVEAKKVYGDPVGVSVVVEETT